MLKVWHNPRRRFHGCKKLASARRMERDVKTAGAARHNRRWMLSAHALSGEVQTDRKEWDRLNFQCRGVVQNI